MVNPSFSLSCRQLRDSEGWHGLEALTKITGSPTDELAFPHLRDLLLEPFHVLSTLLGPNTQVRSLFINSTHEGASKFLRARGHIATLHSLLWKKRNGDGHDDLLAFLEKNPQLSSFEALLLSQKLLSAPVFANPGTLP